LNSPHAELSAAVARHGLQLPEDQMAQLQQYCELLWDWNTKINLTRHTDHEKFVSRDLLDSLKLAEFLAVGETVLDVGTGGGVPGVILGVVRPDLTVTLAESVGKKARVVAEIVERMGHSGQVSHSPHAQRGVAPRVSVFHGRAEDALAQRRYTSLLFRAVARMTKLLQWFAPHWDRFDRMLMVKGPSWVDERGEARHFGQFHGLSLRKLASYRIPGNEAESVVLEIRRKVEGGTGQDEK
jgi:16S rRNA (guanine527-N7)-methyltransferase